MYLSNLSHEYVFLRKSLQKQNSIKYVLSPPYKIKFYTNI